MTPVPIVLMQLSARSHGESQYSYRSARASNEALCEEHVPILFALGVEEKSWMLRVAVGFS